MRSELPAEEKREESCWPREKKGKNIKGKGKTAAPLGGEGVEQTWPEKGLLAGNCERKREVRDLN